MKKTILLLTIAFSLCAINKATAQTVASGQTGDCTWTVTGTEGDYTLTISGIGAMENYYVNGTPFPWEPYKDYITTVIIEYGVTAIGSWAFGICYNLTEVTISNSVVFIGERAFYDCHSLMSVTIGNSVATIGLEAFSYCHNLTSVFIPYSVTEIGDWAFSGCSGLTNIDVDENNFYYSSIDGVLFNKSQDLLIRYPAGRAGSYTIPNSVTTIEKHAFSDCYNLTSVTIPHSVVTIRHTTFIRCTGLTSVFIPNSVTTIEEDVFHMCNSLINIDVDTGNPSYSSVAGVLFNKSQDVLIQYPCGRIGSYAIPNSVTTIENHAFYECTGLTELYVGAQIPPALGSSVFSGMPTTIPVHVPCGTADAYRGAYGWYRFSNYVDDLPLFNITVESADPTMGTAAVTQANTCTDNTAVIAATANAGYRFVQWNDGKTDNPRTVTVTGDITFTATFEEDSEGGTGMTGTDASTVAVYPNPVRDVLLIQSAAAVEQLSIHGLSGKMLKQISAPNREVNVSDLASGVYLVRIKTAAGEAIRKIVINDK
jgi:hypothetical protein